LFEQLVGHLDQVQYIISFDGVESSTHLPDLLLIFTSNVFQPQGFLVASIVLLASLVHIQVLQV
jgi:hypothetical protein